MVKVTHDPEIDYVSITFRDGVESRSYLQNGIIVREDGRGRVIGLDITDSTHFFSSRDLLTLRQACRILGVSASTLRRRIRRGKVRYTKPNGKDYRFRRADILGLAQAVA